MLLRYRQSERTNVYFHRFRYLLLAVLELTARCSDAPTLKKCWKSKMRNSSREVFKNFATWAQTTRFCILGTANTVIYTEHTIASSDYQCAWYDFEVNRCIHTWYKMSRISTPSCICNTDRHPIGLLKLLKSWATSIVHYAKRTSACWKRNVRSDSIQATRRSK